jgi:4'-phosphopantetheinyl transferase
MKGDLMFSSEWSLPIVFPWLQENDIHVWRFETQPSDFRYDKMFGLLSAKEKERALRFRFEKDRREFVMARGALRMLLGGYLRRPPRQVIFSENEYGKPALVNGKRIVFNVSHSHGLILLAFAKNCAVGIDVERIEELDFGSMAERFFAKREVETLFSLPEEEQLQAFYLCWTRKEALVKAVGDGLSYPLDHFVVSNVPDELAQILEIEEGDALWRLWDVSNLPVYAAALVCDRDEPVIKFWEWQYCVKHQMQRIH